MNCLELQNIIDKGEDSLNQFKQDFESIDNFDLDYFHNFYQKVYDESLENMELTIFKLLENLRLMKNEQLTLAGLLLFGKAPNNIKPQFCIKATSFQGNEIATEWYKDRENITGKLIEQFKAGLHFIQRNLKRVQEGRNFNDPPILEIPAAALAEALANAIVHRDYFIHAPIYIHLFDNRLEIVSPGSLPNSVTTENIKYGIHIERNPLILSFLEKEEKFHYSGRGSGIPRMLNVCKRQQVNVQLIDDKEKQNFKVIFSRKG